MPCARVCGDGEDEAVGVPTIVRTACESALVCEAQLVRTEPERPAAAMIYHAARCAMHTMTLRRFCVRRRRLRRLGVCSLCVAASTFAVATATTHLETRTSALRSWHAVWTVRVWRRSRSVCVCVCTRVAATRKTCSRMHVATTSAHCIRTTTNRWPSLPPTLGTHV